MNLNQRGSGDTNNIKTVPIEEMPCAYYGSIQANPMYDCVWNFGSMHPNHRSNVYNTDFKYNVTQDPNYYMMPTPMYKNGVWNNQGTTKATPCNRQNPLNSSKRSIQKQKFCQYNQGESYYVPINNSYYTMDKKFTGVLMSNYNYNRDQIESPVQFHFDKAHAINNKKTHYRDTVEIAKNKDHEQPNPNFKIYNFPTAQGYDVTQRKQEIYSINDKSNSINQKTFVEKNFYDADMYKFYTPLDNKQCFITKSPQEKASQEIPYMTGLTPTYLNYKINGKAISTLKNQPLKTYCATERSSNPGRTISINIDNISSEVNKLSSSENLQYKNDPLYSFKCVARNNSSSSKWSKPPETISNASPISQAKLILRNEFVKDKNMYPSEFNEKIKPTSGDTNVLKNSSFVYTSTASISCPESEFKPTIIRTDFKVKGSQSSFEKDFSHLSTNASPIMSPSQISVESNICPKLNLEKLKEYTDYYNTKPLNTERSYRFKQYMGGSNFSMDQSTSRNNRSMKLLTAKHTPSVFRHKKRLYTPIIKFNYSTFKPHSSPVPINCADWTVKENQYTSFLTEYLYDKNTKIDLPSFPLVVKKTNKQTCCHNIISHVNVAKYYPEPSMYLTKFSEHHPIYTQALPQGGINAHVTLLQHNQKNPQSSSESDSDHDFISCLC